MFEKSFDLSLKFSKARSGLLYPVVRAVFPLRDGNNPVWPLLLDTGADTIVLHRRFEQFFDDLEPETFKGFGKKAQRGKKTRGKVRIFGREVECTIGFTDFELLAYRLGFLGREALMSFGIGFWESEREFYVALTP